MFLIGALGWLNDYKTTSIEMNKVLTPINDVRVAGHRGHSAGAPENTYAAFSKAREYGGAGVTCETDLAFTKDGQLVLFHDEMIDRTSNGHGLVSSMTYAELSQLDVGYWFSSEFAGQRIPLLTEAIEFARKNDIIFQLELKIFNRNNEFFSKLRTLIDETNCADHVQFSSFDFLQLRELKRVIPEVPTVGISHSRMIDPAAIAREANVDAINLEIQHFPSGEAKQLKAAGFAVFLHVPRAEKLDKLLSYGGRDIRTDVVQWVREGLLDQILSDDVALVAEIKREAFEVELVAQ